MNGSLKMANSLPGVFTASKTLSRFPGFAIPNETFPIQSKTLQSQLQTGGSKRMAH